MVVRGPFTRYVMAVDRVERLLRKVARALSAGAVDYAIIGASAIDEDGALLDFDYREVRAAQAIIENARFTYLVADNTKFARSAPVRIGRITDIHGFFTDAMPPDTVRQHCAELGIRLSVVDKIGSEE